MKTYENATTKGTLPRLGRRKNAKSMTGVQVRNPGSQTQNSMKWVAPSHSPTTTVEWSCVEGRGTPRVEGLDHAQRSFQIAIKIGDGGARALLLLAAHCSGNGELKSVLPLEKTLSSTTGVDARRG
jgi:hypothetical protein